MAASYISIAPPSISSGSSEAAGARARRADAINDGPLEKAHPHHREVLDAVHASHGQSSRRAACASPNRSPSMPMRCRPAKRFGRGFPIREPLPGQQEHIRYVASEPAQHKIAPESAMQRTVYFEKPAAAGKPTTFSVTYELTIFGAIPRDRPGQGVPATTTPELAPYRGANARRTSCSPMACASSRARSSATRRIRTASRRNCSPPSTEFPGPARANTRRSRNIATTRCTPATRIAASRRCC